MINYNEIEQFVMFAETGSLAAAAERLHISSPTLSRTMANIEEDFGVALFHRKKNRLELNDSGRLAAQLCRELLEKTEDTIRQVKNYDISQRTISVKSCAPAPLWKLLPQLGALYPAMTVNSSICDMDAMAEAADDDSCDILILPYKDEKFNDSQQFLFMEEHLSAYLREDHELASKQSVSFSELNGYNFLLQSELGFWDNMCRKAMPSSRFLVQTDLFEFNELVANSSLPSFITDAAVQLGNALDDGMRVSVPISDAEANVTFYCVLKDHRKFRELMKNPNL